MTPVNRLTIMRKRLGFAEPNSVMPSPPQEPFMTRHQITRLRHDTRRRTLTVAGIETLGAHMRRIRFTSPELHDFVSASADDHIKLFFATPAGPVMRDFTPRHFDTAAGELVIDFALHDSGPATLWAAGAAVGDHLDIGGPRGSAVVPDDFDWYLLIGDESALPAIGRRVEELRAGVPVITLAVVDSADDEQGFATHAAWTGHWAHRGGAATDDGALLIDALKGVTLPQGEGYVWIAAETAAAKALRAHVLDTLGHPREWLKAAGYWTQGLADASDKSLEG
jgi:NADPH-dependent ferric siderophore reductase